MTKTEAEALEGNENVNTTPEESEEDDADGEQ